MKRFVDILGASVGLVFLAPLLPFVALAIKINSRGPIFVKLNRVSGGKVIKVYKFRSMINNAHAMKNNLVHLNERRDGPFFKIKDRKSVV